MFRIKIAGNKYKLPNEATVIGRSDDADITVDSTKLSRAHARIIIKGDEISIEDLDSKNGTFVNSKRIEGKRGLIRGDKVQVADIECVIVYPDTMTSAPKPEAQPATLRSEERAQKLRRKKVKQRMITAVVVAVLLIGGGIFYSHIKNYVPIDQRKARVLIQELKTEFSSVALSEDIEENNKHKGQLANMIKDLNTISSEFEQEKLESRDLIRQLEKKLKEIEIRNTRLQTELSAMSLFNDIEGSITESIVSYQTALLRLEELKVSYPSTRAAVKTDEKIREIRRVIQGQEKKIFDAAVSRAENLERKKQFRQAISVIDKCLQKGLTQTYERERDNLRSLRKGIYQRAEEYFNELIEQAVADARTGDCEQIKSEIESECSELGFSEFEGALRDAVARIDEIKAERIARARAKLQKDIQKIEKLEAKRMYAPASELYRSLILRITEPELRKEIETRKKYNDLRKKAKQSIIRFVNGKNGIDVVSLGHIKSMSEKQVMLEIEGKSMGIPWNRIRDNEFMALLSKVLKKNPDAKLYMACAVILLEKGDEGEADEYLAKALSTSKSIESEYPEIVGPYTIRIAKRKKEQAKLEKERKRKESGAPRLIRLKGSRGAPEWAKVEFAAFKSIEEVYCLFIDTLVKDNMAVNLRLNSGNFDDIMEFFAVWDKYIINAGSERLKKAYVDICERYYRFFYQEGLIQNGFLTPGFDAEHWGEFMMYIWNAMEVDPDNEYLAQENEKMADLFMSSKMYNPKTRLLKSCWPRASGPCLDPGVNADYNQNLIMLNAAWKAYMTSGEEKYRKWALEYGASWAELAKENNGIFPYQVSDKNREIGPFSEGKWYRGPYTEVGKSRGWDRAQTICNWDYTGSFGVTTRAMLCYVPILCMLDGGNPVHAEPVWTTVQAMFASRNDGMPSFGYDENGWKRVEKRVIIVPVLLDCLYVSTFDKKYLKKIQDYQRAAGGTSELSVLRYMDFLYLKKGGMNLAVKDLKRIPGMGQKAKDEILAAGGKLPSTDQDLEWMSKFQFEELRGLHFVDGAVWNTPWSSSRYGNPSNASIRYFSAEGRTGLPQKTAALVVYVAEKELILNLYNDNETATKILLTAGHYGQHRFMSLNGTPIGEHRILVEIPAKSAVKLDFKIIRYAYSPTLKPYLKR